MRGEPLKTSTVDGDIVYKHRTEIKIYGIIDEFYNKLVLANKKYKFKYNFSPFKKGDFYFLFSEKSKNNKVDKWDQLNKYKEYVYEVFDTYKVKEFLIEENMTIEQLEINLLSAELRKLECEIVDHFFENYENSIRFLQEYINITTKLLHCEILERQVG